MFKQAVNKKAQVGETVTWIIATVIIIVILAISIFIATITLGGDNTVRTINTKDTLASKSFFSYLLTENTEERIIYEQLKSERNGNLNEFNGDLARRIFLDYYSEEYRDVWLGIMQDIPPYQAFSNDYFGRKDVEISSGAVSLVYELRPYISEKIKLNENNSVELVLVKHEN